MESKLIGVKEFYDILQAEMLDNLHEAPMHLDGDAPFEDDLINDRTSDIAKSGMIDDYTLVTENLIHNLDLYVHKNGNYYCLGQYFFHEKSNKERFTSTNYWCRYKILTKYVHSIGLGKLCYQ